MSFIFITKHLGAIYLLFIRQCSCDCLVVPCCNGKISQDQGQYPLSSDLSSVMTSSEYTLVSRMADNLSNYAAKCMVEWDRYCKTIFALIIIHMFLSCNFFPCFRAKWAEEQGASVNYFKMSPVTATPKHLMIYCKFT